MRTDIAPPPGASLNDIDAINAIIMHPEVYGEAGRIDAVGDRLVVTMPGVAVCFREIGTRAHECHQAVIPEMRGKAALTAMHRIREWWWETQPSDLLIGAIPDNKIPARFLMSALGFERWGEIVAPCIDGLDRKHITYRMERPQ